MNKKESNTARINKIKEERYELLKEVRENINNCNEKVLDNASDIINALNCDEKNIKKYEALKKAQSLIESLTKEIANATTKEEVESLRKKLNYYINKVKDEAKKRNIDYSKYYEHATNLRKNIAKYIRFIKRKEQIDMLENVNNNYEELNDDALKMLSKQISSARNYNTRVIKEGKRTSTNNNSSLVTMEQTKEEEIENVSLNNETEIKEITLDDIKRKRDRNISRAVIDEDIPQRHLRVKRSNMDSIGDFRSDKKRLLPEPKKFESDKDFISSRVDEFDNRYQMLNPIEYNQSFGKNIVSFMKNIPIYSINKRKLERIKLDYSLFHRSEDLGIYMKYVKMDNSIIEGLRKVFHNSSLYNNEEIYLNNHERCVNWILSVVREKDIQLNYRLAK